jgi:rhodanese-related sulfurtransferase
MKEAKSISKAELKNLIHHEQKVLVIDVRSPEEYQTQHLPMAINLPVGHLESRKLDLEEDVTIVTVCGKGGGRSESAAKFIQSNYSNEVFFLGGGTFGWFDEPVK